MQKKHRKRKIISLKDVSLASERIFRLGMPERTERETLTLPIWEDLMGLIDVFKYCLIMYVSCDVTLAVLYKNMLT